MKSYDVITTIIDAISDVTVTTEEFTTQQNWNTYVCPYDRNFTDYELICNGPHGIDSRSHIVFLHSYITPLLVTITVITNILVCIVLLRSTRSPTNTLLVAMAVSDTLTGLWPIPSYAYFYIMGNYKDWLPFSWCAPYFFFIDYLPTIFHTASIWLTVSLAVQRYVSVCHPLTGKRLCTVQNVLKVIACIYIASLLSQFSKIMEMDFHRVELPSKTDPTIMVTACYETLTPLLNAYLDVYYNTYYWFRVIFIHLIPCCSLVILNAILIQTMRAAQKRRSLLLRQNRRVESRRLEESTSTTMMLVTVVGLFLLVEVPLAIFLIALIWDNSFREHSTIDKQTVDDVVTVINFFILLSYPLNFFIYCSMSRQFRLTFRRLFVPQLGAPVPNEASVDTKEPEDENSRRVVKTEEADLNEVTQIDEKRNCQQTNGQYSKCPSGPPMETNL